MAREPGALLLGGLAAYALAYVLWTALRQSASPRGQFALESFGLVPASVVLFLLIWRVATGPPFDPRSSSAWRRIGAAFLVATCGDLLWTGFETLGQDPGPTVAAIPYLAYYPILLWGLLSFPSVFETPTGRIQFGLDVATVVLGGGMVVWYFVLGPLAMASRAHPTVTALSMAYPVGDMVVILGIALLVLSRHEARIRPAFSLLTAGLLLILAGDMVYGAQAVANTYEQGGWSDRLEMLALLLIGASAFAHRRLALTAAEPADAAAPSATLSLAPYGAAAIGLGTLALTARERWMTDLGVPVASAALLTGIVLARQLLAVRDNMRLQAEIAARRSEERFRSLIQNASDVILVVDEGTTIRYLSPSVRRVLGYPPEELLGGRLLDLVNHEDSRLIAGLLRDVTTGPGAAGSVDCRVRRSDDGWVFVEVTAADLRADPNVDGIVLTLRDVQQRKLLEGALSHQALHDPLTGLANRVLLQDRLTQAVARVQRDASTLAVLFLDLDNFKDVNDSLGHGTGDLILVEVGQRIRECIRTTDTAARLGGDEFAVLLEETSGQAEVTRIVERVRDRLRLPFAVQGKEVFLSVSVGVVASSGGPETPDELVRNADVAMYAAKRRGKDQAALFEPDMHAAVVGRLELESDLGRAVERGEFLLHYQPIVDLHTRRPAGAEALARWSHPRRGLLPPNSFIPLAEETGRIVPLGRWVLEQACRQAATWAAQPPEEVPHYVSVNLSVRQMQDPGFVEDVLRAVQDARLDPWRLVLEITESLVMRERMLIVARLQELRRFGIRLAIDDFGTGYSALSYLHNLPVDVLKIDKLFVDKAGTSPSASRLVRGIVDLGKALGMVMVAEGIETVEQADALREFGCQFGQGFYFSRPLAAPELSATLTSASARHGDGHG